MKNIKIKHTKAVIFLLIWVFAFPDSVFSKTLILVNRTVYRGDVKVEGNNVIFSDGGRIQKFSQSQVLKIIYRNISDAEAKQIIEEELAKRKKTEAVKEKPKKEEAKPENAPAKKTEEKISDPPETKVSGFGIMTRASLLPGWGHIYSDHNASGYAYLTLYTASLIAIYTYGQNIESTRKRYREENLNIQFALKQNSVQNAVPAARDFLGSAFLGAGLVKNSYQTYENSVRNYNNVLALPFFIYGVQLFHAWRISRKINSENSGLKLELRSIDSGRMDFSSKKENLWELRYDWIF